jgi:hypothetical protein
LVKEAYGKIREGYETQELKEARVVLGIYE